MAELLVILLIFSLGVILLTACFVGGVAVTLGAIKKFIKWLFGKDGK